MLRRYLESMFSEAMRLNRDQILRSLPRKTETLLDLGCDDGEWTLQVKAHANAMHACGLEIVESRAETARSRGIETVVADLGSRLPFQSDSFDLVHANQVIEHVPDVDLFTSEIFRVLCPGGTVVLSTENTSSWHNVFASALGWQMFSLTNMSEKRLGIGNPLALHRGEGLQLKSWTHKTLFSYRGLKEFVEAHGFAGVTIRGAGYYPFPAQCGVWEPRHAAFITVAGIKPPVY